MVVEPGGVPHRLRRPVAHPVGRRRSPTTPRPPGKRRKEHDTAHGNQPGDPPRPPRRSSRRRVLRPAVAAAARRGRARRLQREGAGPARGRRRLAAPQLRHAVQRLAVWNPRSDAGPFSNWRWPGSQAPCWVPAETPSRVRRAAVTPGRDRNARRNVLLAYFSRPGENYHYGGRRDLRVGGQQGALPAAPRRRRRRRGWHRLHARLPWRRRRGGTDRLRGRAERNQGLRLRRCGEVVARDRVRERLAARVALELVERGRAEPSHLDAERTRDVRREDHVRRS